MARLPRICLLGIPQHIVQRGNNREVCFASEEDFAAYAHWLNEFSQKYRIAIHAWVFMTNHVHLLATSETEDGISRMMQTLGRHYVCYFNYTYKRTDTLWPLLRIPALEAFVHPCTAGRALQIVCCGCGTLSADLPTLHRA